MEKFLSELRIDLMYKNAQTYTATIANDVESLSNIFHFAHDF